MTGEPPAYRRPLFNLIFVCLLGGGPSSHTKSLSRHRAHKLRLPATSALPLPAEDVQSRERDAADGGHQQQPDEDLSEDGVLRHHGFTLRRQPISSWSVTEDIKLLLQLCPQKHNFLSTVLTADGGQRWQELAWTAEDEEPQTGLKPVLLH